MSNGVVIVRTLEPIVNDYTNHTKSNITPLLLTMIQDAKRFILYNRSVIEKSPLQVYASALLFSPRVSLIRRQFLGQEPLWVEVFAS
jgi:hypothetical protein